MLRILFSLFSMLVLVVADSKPCDSLSRLSPCAESCLSNVASPDNCTSITNSVCTAEYQHLTSCYESQCEPSVYLVESADAMNITNTVCNIPARSQQSAQIGVGAAFITIMTLVVGLRLVGRPPSSPSFRADDVFGLIAYGWGVDMWEIDPADIASLLKVWISLALFTKLAILLFYLRFFTTRPFKRVIYAVMASCTAWGIAVVFQNLFYCAPVPYFWNRFDGVSQGTCLSLTVIRVMPPINIALDVVVMALPLPALMRLQLPLIRKVRVISMFLVGILTIIAGVLRLTHFYNYIKVYNITYNGGQLAYFGVIEAGVGVVCTCVPAITALLKRVVPWFDTSAGKRRPMFHDHKEAALRRRNCRYSGIASRTQAGSEVTIPLVAISVDGHHLQKPEKCVTHPYI
ncbi:hypothetical protein BJX99DRAFT_247022 [Aspergillus californicus]